MSSQNWFRRRWFDFRSGHGLYLAFILAFSNFIVITYALLIDRIPEIKETFPNMWIWAVFFVLVYIPTAMVIGYWHRKTQLRVENTISMLENPLFAKWLRILIEMQEGRASKREVEEMKQLLSKIEGSEQEQLTRSQVDKLD
jgi:hypothetical protein